MFHLKEKKTNLSREKFGFLTLERIFIKKNTCDTSFKIQGGQKVPGTVLRSPVGNSLGEM